MRTSNGWIFSLRADLLLFGASVLFALSLGPLGLLLGLSAEKPVGWSVSYHGVLLTLRVGMIVDFCYHVLIDGPHALATVYRVYVDPPELQRRPYLYWGSPIAVFLFLMIFAQLSQAGLLRFVSYLNIFHYIRQQYGWVRISGYKGEPLTKSQRIWDGLAIYAVTLCPLVWWHGHKTGDGWLYNGDLVQVLPAALADILFSLQFVILAFYIYQQFRLYRQGHSLNGAKYFLIFITLFSWTGGIVGGWAGEQTFMLDILHAVPYLGLVFYYGQRRFKATRGWRGRIFSKRGWFLYYLPLVAAAYLSFDFGFQLKSLPSWSASLGLSILLMPPVMHYVLDGFVWRSGPSNPGLGKIMGL